MKLATFYGGEWENEIVKDLTIKAIKSNGENVKGYVFPAECLSRKPQIKNKIKWKLIMKSIYGESIMYIIIKTYARATPQQYLPEIFSAFEIVIRSTN